MINRQRQLGPSGTPLKKKGFATVMALVSLSLVGVTIAGLMTRISMQAKLTKNEVERAQHEQIVIAQSLGGKTKLPDELRSR
jgi:type II secretory pathway component PulK